MPAPKLNEALETFLLALWDQVGEEATKVMTFHLHPKAIRAIEAAYPYNRTEFKPGGRRILHTAMGDVTLVDEAYDVQDVRTMYEGYLKAQDLRIRYLEHQREKDENRITELSFRLQHGGREPDGGNKADDTDVPADDGPGAPIAVGQ